MKGKVISASLPTIILPAIVIVVVIIYFGVTLESLVVILSLGELYMVWAQLEIALRQTHLSVLEFEPELKIDISVLEPEPELKIDIKPENLSIVTEKKDHLFFNLRLVNIGKHLARNVFVSLNVKGKKEEHKFIPFTNIDPGASVYLHTFDEDLLNNNTITVDVSYENIMGELSEVSFIKDPKLPDFIVVRRVRMPGLLLNSYKDLISILRLFIFLRRAKKPHKKSATHCA